MKDYYKTATILILIIWLTLGGFTLIMRHIVPDLTSQEKVAVWTFEQTAENGDCQVTYKRNLEEARTGKEYIESQLQACKEYYADYIYKETLKIKKHG